MFSEARAPHKIGRDTPWRTRQVAACRHRETEQARGSSTDCPIELLNARGFTLGSLEIRQKSRIFRLRAQRGHCLLANA